MCSTDEAHLSVLQVSGLCWCPLSVACQIVQAVALQGIMPCLLHGNLFIHCQLQVWRHLDEEVAGTAGARTSQSRAKPDDYPLSPFVLLHACVARPRRPLHRRIYSLTRRRPPARARARRAVGLCNCSEQRKRSKSQPDGTVSGPFVLFGGIIPQLVQILPQIDSSFRARDLNELSR